MIKNAFILRRSGSGNSLKFFPRWTGREQHYQSTPIPTRGTRLAVCAAENAVFFASAGVTRSTLEVAVHRWPEQQIFGGECPVPSGTELLDFAVASANGAFHVGALLDHSGDISLALLTSLAPTATPVPVSLPFRRESATDEFAVGATVDGSRFVVIRRAGNQLQIAVLTVADGRFALVGSRYYRHRSVLNRRRNGLVLDDFQPQTNTEWSDQPFPEEEPPAWAGKRLLATPVLFPVPSTVCLRLVANEHGLTLFELRLNGASSDVWRCHARVLANLLPGDGFLPCGASQSESAEIIRDYARFGLTDVLLLDSRELALADPTPLKLTAAVASVLDLPRSYYYRFNQTERQHLLRHPFDSIVGYVCAVRAMKSHGEGDGDAEDALRHALWAALVAQLIGEREALHVLGDHETDTTDEFELAMDIHNNSMGARLGAQNPDLTKDQLLEKIKELAARGFLMHEGNKDAAAKWEAAQRRQRESGNRESGGGNRGGMGDRIGDPRDGRPDRAKPRDVDVWLGPTEVRERPSAEPKGDIGRPPLA